MVTAKVDATIIKIIQNTAPSSFKSSKYVFDANPNDIERFEKNPKILLITTLKEPLNKPHNTQHI